MLCFQTERGRVKSPSSTYYFSVPFSSEQSICQSSVFGVTFSDPFHQLPFSVQSFNSLSFKSIFQRMMLGSSVPKLLWMRHKFRILSLPPNQMKWSIWGGPRVHRFHKFPSSFQIFGFLVHRAPFMHSEKWLQLCGCFLSMGCECQSSRQSSLTPFTHACLPEWPMQEFMFLTPG